MLGGVLLDLGQAQEAVDPLREAVTMAVETIGIGHAWTRIYLGWYATALALSGQETMAAAEFDLSVSSLGNYEGLSDDRQSLA